MLRVVRLIVTVLPSLWPRPFVEVKLTSSPPLQDSPARDSGADPRLLPSVIPAASRLLPDLRQSAIIQTFVGRGHRVGTWRTLGKMRLALERGGEARRHAGIEYLLFWTMERYRGGCGSRGGGARKFPSFFSIVTPVKLWKSGSFRFISVNFGEQTIRFFLYPAGWNADDRWRNDDEKRDDKARDDGNNFRNIFEICVGTSELKNCLCNSLENL